MLGIRRSTRCGSSSTSSTVAGSLGLYRVTPAFFEGRQGVALLPPLAQRLHTDFSTDAQFDNPRAPQVRLLVFDQDRLVDPGGRVRDLYAAGAGAPQRVRALVDDSYLATLAGAVAGGLGGKVGVVPRLFVRKLVGDVLDSVDQYPDFDPRRDCALTVSSDELTLRSVSTAFARLHRLPHSSLGLMSAIPTA
jgi:hypothetical protein